MLEVLVMGSVYSEDFSAVPPALEVDLSLLRAVLENLVGPGLPACEIKSSQEYPSP